MSLETLSHAELAPEELPGDGEVFADTNETSRLEFEKVVKKFAFERGLEIERPITTRPLDAGLEDMNANYALLEDISEKEVGPRDEETEPLFTACMPVAILSDTDSALRLLRELHDKASEPQEIIVWANAKYTADNKEEVTLEAKQEYESFVEAIQTLTGGQLRIRAALQILPEEEASMSKIRSNYMDAALLNTLENGYGFDHAIVWIDADGTFVAEDALPKVANEVRRKEAYLVHADTYFTTEWVQGQPLDELDDATKAVAINEVHRRQYARGENEDELPEGYVEESGLAFAAGVYAAANGVNKKHSVSESTGLIERVWEADARGKVLIPEDLRKGSPKPIPFRQVKSARIGLSGRRHHEVVKQKGAKALVNLDGSGYGQTLFTDMEKVDSIPRITREDMTEVLSTNHAARESGERIGRPGPGPEELARRIRNDKISKALIERYFDN